MDEYYFDHWQWRDLKWCVEEGDIEGIQALIKAAEMRWYTMRVAQAGMILDYKYFNNPG